MNNDILVFNRDSLNETLTLRLGMKVNATDEQWQQVADSIHNDDEAWDYINHTVHRAIDELVDPLVKSLQS